MLSAWVILTLWVRWRKPAKLAITLGPKDVKGAQDIKDNTDDNYIRAEVVFNSLMTELFGFSSTNGLIQSMTVHVKIQLQNPQMPKTGFTLDQIVYLHKKLALRQGSSYIELPRGSQRKRQY